MYKLIATDLDGTLLNDSDGVPEANIEYIEKAVQNGCMVALCSGRSYVSLNVFEKKLGLNKKGCYGICFNGGIVYDAYTNEILSDIRMQLSSTLELIDEIKRIMNLHIESGLVDILVYASADLYIEKTSDNENTKSYSDRSNLKRIKLNDFNEMKDHVTKILLKGDNTALTKIESEMKQFCVGKCKIFFTSKNLLEFIPPESGKGRGIEILANILGIEMSQVISVGDQVNDLEMIEAAGLGVAVQNAVDAVKDVADYVAESDNNTGVIREIVQKFVIKE